MSTSGKSIDDVFTHIAQRTFDSSSPVRLMVVEVVGKWLIELRDRYVNLSSMVREPKSLMVIKFPFIV